MSDPEVSLVFPPLVTTNFGNYYPSTALLSGYLKANGFETSQTDLNEEFALFLLRPETLASIDEGDFGVNLELPESSMPRVAARLLARNQTGLFDDAGRHIFSDKKPGSAHLLRRLGEAYRVDLDLDDMARTNFFESPIVRFYREFYRACGYAENLPAATHLVGISVALGPQLVPALALVRHLRQVRPDLRIVLGGPSLSLMNQGDLNRFLTMSEDLDAVVRFDGEMPLLALAKQSRSEQWRPWEVPNVSCLKSGRPHHSQQGAGPKLNDLPFGDYDPAILGRLSDPEIGIVQARGCYWGKCAYCDYIELYKGSPRYRTRTADRFIAEMKYQIQKHGRSRFAIITESIPPSFARRMSSAILEDGLDVSWSSFAMVDKHFTPELFKNMALSGCDYLEIGVESMTDRVLALVEKAATMAMNQQFLRSAAEVGVSLKVNIIPDLPSTTYREALDSLDGFKALEDSIARVGVYPFEPTRSSRIGRNPHYYHLTPTQSGELNGQSQYPANHFDCDDLAMTSAQRELVHQKFFAFREKVNGRGGAALDPTLVTSAASLQVPLKLAVDCVDMCPVEEGLQCYHLLTRELFVVGRRWTGLFEAMTSKVFSGRTFVDAFPDESQGREVLDRLVQFRLLQRCDDAGVDSLDLPDSFCDHLADSDSAFALLGNERLLDFDRLDEVIA